MVKHVQKMFDQTIFSNIKVFDQNNSEPGGEFPNGNQFFLTEQGPPHCANGLARGTYLGHVHRCGRGNLHPKTAGNQGAGLGGSTDHLVGGKTVLLFVLVFVY